jgi:serine/threonine protein kinase
VYRARHKQNNTIHAIKIIKVLIPVFSSVITHRCPQLTDAETKELAKREALTAKKLRHPNIVTCDSYFEGRQKKES